MSPEGSGLGPRGRGTEARGGQRRVRKEYHRQTQTLTKGRRRKPGKTYGRKRKVDPRRYPKAAVQVSYERPSRSLREYHRPKRRRKTKG